MTPNLWLGARKAAAVLSAIVLATTIACGGDSPTGPRNDGGGGDGGGGGGGGAALANGSMTARLDGVPWTANFLVKATIVPAPAGQLSTIQITGVDTSDGGLNRTRQIIVTVLRDSPPSTGSFPIGLVTANPSYSSLGHFQQVTNVWSTVPQSISQAASGTMVVTSFTADRIAGTFFFTAPAFTGNAANFKQPVVITEGKFDIRYTGG